MPGSGPSSPARLRGRAPRPGDKWHFDEVFVKICGVRKYLWRAVDQHGNVLDILIQDKRDGKAETLVLQETTGETRPPAAGAGPTDNSPVTRSCTGRRCQQLSTGKTSTRIIGARTPVNRPGNVNAR
ncbi:DDE-type integrase/transposase/recombinase [Rhodococcus qingshengii]|uniref:DDE-type integrase/transposase/recombinase n=1 Tax=Rhodococcus qingshengii TaxID=334542 RepID=UPI0035E17574